MPPSGGWLACGLAVLLLAGPAAGQRSDAGPMVLVPFDIGQGAVTNVSGTTPYVAAAKLQVALGLGRGGPVRVGPVAAVRYTNPDWSVAAGARVQWLPLRFGLGGERWGLGLAAEQLWGTAGDRPASVGVIGDLELIRMAAWLVHDWSDERTGFELSAGTDLRSILAVLFPAPDDQPFPDIP